MFKGFKDKLKSALNIFAKKVDEEAVEEVIETEVVVPKKAEPKVPTPKNQKPPQKTPPLAKPKVDVKPAPKPELKKSSSVPESTTQKQKSESVSVAKAEQKKIEQEQTKSQQKTDESVKPKPTKPVVSPTIQKQTDVTPNPAVTAEKKSEREVTPQRVETPAESQNPTDVAVTQKPKEKSFFSKLFSKSKTEDVPKVPEVQTVTAVEADDTDDFAPHTHIPADAKPDRTQEKAEPVVEEKKGFFERISQSITTKKLSDAQFEELFFELELLLLENNVAVEVIEKIKEDLRVALVNKQIKRSEILDVVVQTLKNTVDDILSVPPVELLSEISQKKPYVITVIGVNGSGKTTTIAKLVQHFKAHNLKVVIGACDTFRAAAIQQLEEHATRLETKLIKHDYGADAAAVAYDTVAHAKAKGIDVVLIDTAGRLHSNTNLMAELTKIHKVVNPDFTLFIGESITGNDCVEQAMQFNEAVGIDGIILTKADVDEKGGAALSVSYVTQKPILFFANGQNYDDLVVFDKAKVIENLGL